MYLDKYEEHLRDSAPDNSRWDGFDRGDLDEVFECHVRVVAEAVNRHGIAVSLLNHTDSYGADDWIVTLNGEYVFLGDTEARARAEARSIYATAH